jgi:hypothetical protein
MLPNTKYQMLKPQLLCVAYIWFARSLCGLQYYPVKTDFHEISWSDEILQWKFLGLMKFHEICHGMFHEFSWFFMKRIILSGRIAQVVERPPLDREVRGSNPSHDTMALLLGWHYEFPQCGTIKGKLLLLLLYEISWTFWWKFSWNFMKFHIFYEIFS